MDSRYKQLSCEDQLIEECAELIQALSKLKRFGYTAVDPFTGKQYDNIKQCLAEIKDVKESIGLCLLKWDETE